jgi:hypothetical protein
MKKKEKERRKGNEEKGQKREVCEREGIVRKRKAKG